MTPTRPHLFISYRNADTGGVADRLYADLHDHLAGGQIFLDNERLEPGKPWPDSLREAVDRATAMIVLIGTQWLRAQDPDTGDRRLNQQDDWVRREIEAGLGGDGVVLPVLVDDARPLEERHLSTVPSIAPLAHLQALRLRRTDWRADVAVLADYLAERGFERRAPGDADTEAKEQGASLRIALDRLEQWQERVGGKALTYGTIRLRNGALAFGKGLRLGLTLENTSRVDVIVRTLDLIVDEFDEHPLEDLDYEVFETSGMHLEMPSSELAEDVELTAGAADLPVPLMRRRLFLTALGAPESQHSVTAGVAADASGLWRLRVRATFSDAPGSGAPAEVTSDQMIIALK